jgi:hypothetical protein
MTLFKLRLIAAVGVIACVAAPKAMAAMTAEDEWYSCAGQPTRRAVDRQLCG